VKQDIAEVLGSRRRTGERIDHEKVKMRHEPERLFGVPVQQYAG
jgi:truncated hemoglobin YjbI